LKSLQIPIYTVISLLENPEAIKLVSATSAVFPTSSFAWCIDIAAKSLAQRTEAEELQ
jgi:hypothetical protein